MHCGFLSCLTTTTLSSKMSDELSLLNDRAFFDVSGSAFDQQAWSCQLKVECVHDCAHQIHCEECSTRATVHRRQHDFNHTPHGLELRTNLNASFTRRMTSTVWKDVAMSTSMLVSSAKESPHIPNTIGKPHILGFILSSTVLRTTSAMKIQNFIFCVWTLCPPSS